MVIDVCSPKFQWSHSSSSYSVSAATTPPRIAKYHAATSIRTRCKTSLRKQFKFKAAQNHQLLADEQEEEEEEFPVLSAVQSNYNRFLILDTPKSRLLLLDFSHNVHSILNKDTTKWTGSYWDECATLPPVVPTGWRNISSFDASSMAFIAAGRLGDRWDFLPMNDDTPILRSKGQLIDKSRDYFGLLDLEKHTTDGGVLNVHIGDVFSPEAAISGGYAGIIVDLFAQGKVLPQLEQAATWLELYERLMPEGRFMVTCGAGEKGVPATNAISQDDGSSTDSSWKLNATIRALCEAFPGKVNWKKLAPGVGENYLALTGTLPDLTLWSAAAPDELNSSVNQWRTCNNHTSGWDGAT